MSTESIKAAYNAFRARFAGGPLSDWAPPQWEDLDAWMRDAITAAYQQGTLDGAPRRLSEKEGFLRMQPSGCWAVCRFGLDPVEITSGEVFRVEVVGKEGLQLTRMEYAPGGGYYTVDDYELRAGLRAAIGGGE